MDSAHAREDALGATLKAIQSIELAGEGRAVHPRAGDLSVPSFFFQRCTQCKRCTEECPFALWTRTKKVRRNSTFIAAADAASAWVLARNASSLSVIIRLT